MITPLILAWAFAQAPPLPPQRESRTHHQTFKIPFNLPPGAEEQVASLALFVSRDGGATWTYSASASPRDDHFPFTATTGGAYTFSVQTRHNDGASRPADLKDLAPLLRVMVLDLPKKGK